MKNKWTSERRYELREDGSVLVAKRDGFYWKHWKVLRGKAALKIIKKHKLTKENNFIQV